MRRTFLALSLAALAAAVAASRDDIAPLLANYKADHIPNSYIVKFKKHVDESAASEHRSWVDDIHLAYEETQIELKKRGIDEMLTGIKHTYKLGAHFLGYAGDFDDEVVEQLRRHPDVRLFPVQFHSCKEFHEACSLVTFQMPSGALCACFAMRHRKVVYALFTPPPPSE